MALDDTIPRDDATALERITNAVIDSDIVVDDARRDLLTAVGYVIGPGSVHASGIVYTEAGDWTRPRADVPRFWPGWLQRPENPVPSRNRVLHRQPGDVVERARRYLAAIPRPEIGAGSDAQTLYAACRLTRGFGLAEADATELLWEWAGGRPGWTRDWLARKVAHAVRYGTEPIGGLA